MLGEFWVVELHNIMDRSQMEQSYGSAIPDQGFGFPVKLYWAGPDPTYANFILIQIIRIQKMLGEFWGVELHNIMDRSQMEQLNGSAILDQGFGAKFWQAFTKLSFDEWIQIPTM